MTAALETRLRQALAARADVVTLETLVRHHPAPTLPRPIDSTTSRYAARPRWAIPAAAAATILVVGTLAVGTGLIDRPDQPAPGQPTTVATAPSGTDTATSSPSQPTASSTSSTPATGAAIVPTQRPAAEIPWTHVGPGWVVAEFAPGAVGSDVAAPQIYLLSPLGTRFRIDTAALDRDYLSWRVLGATAGGQRVLLLTNQGEIQALVSIDLRTGRRAQVAMFEADLRIEATFADSAGDSVLVSRWYGNGGYRLDRYQVGGDSTGFEYPLGQPKQLSVLPSADGQQLVIWTDAGLALYRRDGQRLTSLPIPTGMTTCVPLRWFDAQRATVACTPAGARGSGRWTPFAYALDGSAPEQLTSRQPWMSGNDLYPDRPGSPQAWKLGEQLLSTYASPSTGQTSYTYGSGPAAQWATLPATASGHHPAVIAVVDRTAWAMTFDVTARVELALLDPATMSVTVVLGGPAQGSVHPAVLAQRPIALVGPDLSDIPPANP